MNFWIRSMWQYVFLNYLDQGKLSELSQYFYFIYLLWVLLRAKINSTCQWVLLCYVDQGHLSSLPPSPHYCVFSMCIYLGAICKCVFAVLFVFRMSISVTVFPHFCLFSMPICIRAACQCVFAGSFVFRPSISTTALFIIIFRFHCMSR